MGKKILPFQPKDNAIRRKSLDFTAKMIGDATKNLTQSRPHPFKNSKISKPILNKSTIQKHNITPNGYETVDLLPRIGTDVQET